MLNRFPEYSSAGSFTARMLLLIFVFSFCSVNAQVPEWGRFEYGFVSTKDYSNVLYDLKKFSVRFVAPSGRIHEVPGFWDGERNWKVRFMPDETGQWKWVSYCSDTTNTGLNARSGEFNCIASSGKSSFDVHGAVERPSGSYFLRHRDGTPFFWTGCTAWNGTLKSTEKEWDQYLAHRAKNGYSVIQFVTTQWRGCDKNSQGQVAFEGSGRISLNPEFFRHLDGKIDEINKHGLVAAPVLLWALGSVQGRELSPGYYLPEHEAVILARYMVARYGAHQVIWILGGDGKYTGENEQRWKTIGRGVFGDRSHAPVALHPGGGAWLGDIYSGEDWLDIVGYQSGHSNSKSAINFITKGPVAENWFRITPKVLINMEPVYEEIAPNLTASDIRNAAYWSLLNAPAAGITYGADGLWPWLRDGEEILNHAGKGERASRWYKAIDLLGSMQVGYLAGFFKTTEWYKLRPAQDLLVAQPNPNEPSAFVSVSKTADKKNIVIYIPKPCTIQLYNSTNAHYSATWFDPINNKHSPASIKFDSTHHQINIQNNSQTDRLLVLNLK